MMRTSTTTLRELLPWALLVGAIAAAPTQAAAQAAGVEQHTEAVAEGPAEDEDTTRWALSAGANIATGNTRTQTFNAGTEFYALRGRHAFTLASTFNYGRADTTNDGSRDYQVTARNSNSRFRYDLFLTDNDALFLALAHRWDNFAGIQVRLQTQFGYLRNIIKNEDTRAWIEAGFDYTYDNRFRTVICEDTATCDPVVFNIQNIMALRLFYGATHAFNENVRIATGLEFLANLNSLEGGEADTFEDIRLNWSAQVNAALVDRLSLEVKFLLQYDRVPAARETVDTTTVISLIYTLI